MKWKAFFMLAVSLYFVGCATLFKGTTQEVNFNSNPQKARVIVNGVEMGETPVVLKLETKKTYTIQFQADGYKPKTYTITNHVGAGWVILDVLSGLVGVIIDAATGAWYSLDQNNINAVLEKKFFF
jgi:hypothetical protein